MSNKNECTGTLSINGNTHDDSHVRLSGYCNSPRRQSMGAATSGRFQLPHRLNLPTLGLDQWLRTQTRRLPEQARPSESSPSTMALSDTLSSRFYELILGLVVLYFSQLLFYRLLFHPLRHFPGDKLSALTKWTWDYYASDPAYLEKLHAKYGPVIRICPNEVNNDHTFVITWM